MAVIVILIGIKERLCLHTATLRIMLGANPSKTHLLLKHTRATASNKSQQNMVSCLHTVYNPG